jgi:glycolate oxidase iron-sulfur subunit
VVLLEGCVQSAATPNTNLAVRGLLERLGLAVLETPAQGCCGALNAHLGNREQALNDMRRNIDAWWAALEGGAEAVVSSATGCASELDHYVSALKDDPAYADKAAKISALACDFGAFLCNEPLHALGNPAVLAQPRVAVQTPCSQTHALRQSHTVKQLLVARGYTLAATRDDHLCCGSAGSYSLLHPQSSGRLRSRKLAALGVDTPDVIASANVGCQLHLSELAGVPVRHWTELIWDSVSYQTTSSDRADAAS